MRAVNLRRALAAAVIVASAVAVMGSGSSNTATKVEAGSSSQSSGGSSFKVGAPRTPDGEVAPGQTIRGTIVIDVPQSATGLQMKFKCDLFSSGSTTISPTSSRAAISQPPSGTSTGPGPTDPERITVRLTNHGTTSATSANRSVRSLTSWIDEVDAVPWGRSASASDRSGHCAVE